MVAALCVAATTLFRDRVPVRACLRLERGACLLIFPELASIFRDGLRRCRFFHCVGSIGGNYRPIDGKRLRRNQQQRERKISGAMANRMRTHPTCLAIPPRKSARKTAPEPAAWS